MHYVYILQSEKDPNRFYTGITSDLERRLKEHNEGKSIHTNKYIPWKIKTYIALSTPEKAEQLEKYLKSGSGRTFTKKYL